MGSTSSRLPEGTFRVESPDRGRHLFPRHYPPSGAFPEFAARVSAAQYGAFIDHINAAALGPYLHTRDEKFGAGKVCCAAVCFFCGGCCYLIGAAQDMEQARVQLLSDMNACLDPFQMQVLSKNGIQANIGIREYTTRSGRSRTTYYIPYIEFRRLNLVDPNYPQHFPQQQPYQQQHYEQQPYQQQPYQPQPYNPKNLASAPEHKAPERYQPQPYQPVSYNSTDSTPNAAPNAPLLYQQSLPEEGEGEGS